MKSAFGQWAGVVFAAGMAAIAMAGCAPVDESDDSSALVDEVSLVRLGAPAYYTVRHDMRRCISPICGGAWVRQVNRSTTRCADGVTRSECYVAQVDWTALGLSERALPGFQERTYSGHAIVRGRVRAHTYGTFGNLGEFVVTEGWQAANDAAPSGQVYQVQNNGRRCIAAPCFVYDEHQLNATAVTPASEVDLTRVEGITMADVDRGNDYLNNTPEGILVAGPNRSVRNAGPAGNGRRLVATQFYFRVSAGTSDAVFCDADSECAMTTFHNPVASADDCYCTICASTVLNVSTAASNESDWTRFCGDHHQICPAVRCMQPPPAACLNHGCVATTR